MLPVYFSRGCVARCTFCAETNYWVRFRVHTPERVIEMMRKSVNEFGITAFRFNDSLMNGSHRHLEKFADQVITSGMMIDFYGYCRLDKELTGELLAKLAKAGCKEVAFGMESGSQNVTDLMRKEVDVNNYVRILGDTYSAGIKALCCVIVGFPGETWIDFFKTVILLFRVRNFVDTLNVSVLSLGHIRTADDEMMMLGIAPGPVDTDRWRSEDGKNTPRVREIRYWLLNALWRRLKTQEISKKSWMAPKRGFLARLSQGGQMIRKRREAHAAIAENRGGRNVSLSCNSADEGAVAITGNISHVLPSVGRENISPVQELPH
jgi:radical SAM superfamily enzyme YgiQ (UPF0313 family)